MKTAIQASLLFVVLSAPCITFAWGWSHGLDHVKTTHTQVNA